MRARRSTLLFLTALCALTMGSGAAYGQASPRQALPREVVPRADVRRPSPPEGPYDSGYVEGLQRGERDARDGRTFDYARDNAYRSADRGYSNNLGSRDTYRSEFRRGFATGYRLGYDRSRSLRPLGYDRLVPRGYREPASARGYSDGYERGLADGRDRDRYDPVRHRDYRSGDDGYDKDYGSRDAYRNNYRAGFRQGYEDGYRTGARR